MAVGNRVLYFGGADIDKNRYNDLHVLTILPGNRLTWLRIEEQGTGIDWPPGEILCGLATKVVPVQVSCSALIVIA